MRLPEMSRRRLVITATAAALALVCVVVLLVPATRHGLVTAWCDITQSACPPTADDPRRDYADGAGWRRRLDPVAAATWGNYVALGDSYSSGDGAGDYAEGTAAVGDCRRSANAYPRHVVSAHDFAGDLGFFACSSQRGWAMLDSLGEPRSQIDRVGPHTSLVTIGIGGNDVGFTKILRACMVRVPLVETQACTEQEEEIEKRMRTFGPTLEEIVLEIRERAPDARVLVVGYPRLFPGDPDSMYYTMAPHDQEWLNAITKRFNEQVAEDVAALDSEIVEAGQTGSVEYVRMYNALKGHEVGTEDPWLNGVLLSDFANGLEIDRSTFHPNARGQQEFAERVLDQVEQGPERPLYAALETLDGADPEVLAAELD
ncbi:SGNH/GDSL hydrolase family protein [Streptomonospora nanhaiensis]|uniref:Lysophospholipase L1-like esterase n=1 Tax=Streptomonospora nanhaiensis TaxID=1323731 RepID=A0A853BJB3_9ACTN|nr:SGNH/GDSL hydrolase family protein [Streptomonospora nanhaiensis]MBV2365649.1 SGNH/GDSL hydrolase family protein [Streptomonospora nanhaiensis]NYI95549.1 lysophospholipase L1-like esterase [Streptomonospora nanhaiensis]